MFQSPRVPVAAHVAVLEGEAHALVGGALGQRAEDLLETRDRFVDRPPAQPAGEAGDDVGAEKVRGVDQRFPAAQGFLVHRAGVERVAEDRRGS